MTHKKLFLGICLSAFVSFSSGNTAFAKEEDIDSLLSLDLESLANVQVSVASKKTEKVSDAPSVVSVITAEDIRHYGANNLKDVLNRQAGIQVYGSSYYADNVASIRGGAIQHENNHVLFLINGRPFRDGLSGGTIAQLIAGFPVNLVDAIEIIRGPGSVLYGSSAFNGIINIKTKSPEKIGNAIVTASYGSFDSMMTDTVGAASGKDWDVVGGFKILRSRGWNYDVIDGAGTAGKFRSDDDDHGLTASGRYKDVTFNFFKGETMGHNLSPIARYPISKNSEKTTFLDVGYEFDLSEKWKVNANTTLNNFDFFSASTARTFKSDDILLELSTRGELSEQLGLLAGGTYENHEGSINGANTNVQWYSGYFQMEYQALDWLKLIAGTQLNKPKDIARDLSPRYAAIANFNENWGVKLMHGAAFRSASFLETALNSPGIIIGNPNLKPEQVSTTEAQLFYASSKHSAAITAYRSEMQDLITRVGAAPINFVNSRSIEFQGVELEGKALLTNEISLTGNAAYQTSKDDLGRRETTYAPNIMVKAGIAYDSPRGFSLGLYDSYFGDPSQVRDFQAVVERNQKPRKYHLVTFNASVNINRFYEGISAPDTTLTLFVDNALDQKIRFPDINNGSINSIPIHSGRAVFGRVAVKF